MFKIFFIALAAFHGFFCSLSLSQDFEKKGATSYQNHSFSFRLFALLDDSAGNTIFSPHAVGSSLYYLALGSNDGARKQIFNALGIESSNKKSSEIVPTHFKEPLGVASAWALPNPGDIKTEFAKKLQTFVGHNFFKASLDNINRWAKEKSQGTIPVILNLLPPGSAVVPISLSNFQLNLDDLSSDTMPSKISVDHKVFYVNSDQLTKTQFYIFAAQLSHIGADSFDAYCFAGALENVNIYFFVPRQASGIREFTNRLNPRFFKSLLDEFDLVPRRSYTLEIPSIDISQYGSLKLPLQGLGVFDSFSLSKSSLSISQSGSDYLSDFIYALRLGVSTKDDLNQEPLAEVDTSGSSPLLEPLRLSLDKPFLIVVTDSQSDNILFLAKILNPAPLYKTN